MTGNYAQLLAYKQDGIKLREDMQLPEFALKRLTKKSGLDNKQNNSEIIKTIILNHRSFKYYKFIVPLICQIFADFSYFYRLPLTSPSSKTIQQIIVKN